MTITGEIHQTILKVPARVHAGAALAVCAHYLPAGRAAALVASLTGANVSAGFTAGVRGRAAARIGPFMDRVRVLLRDAAVLYADETPARTAGKLHYVHVACTEFLTALHTGGRTSQDIDAGGILPGVRRHGRLGRLRGAVAKVITDNQHRRGKAGKDGLRLARRFRDHQDMILRFTTDLAVGFTSNQAERDVRPVKVQMCTSGGCWRTLDGLADFAVVQS